MCSHVERWFALALLALLSVAGACFDSHECGRELCDGKDNDCDHEIDEDFADAQGKFEDDDNCGGCGVKCADVFPSAAQARCVVRDGSASCELVACAEGEMFAGSGACVPRVPVACLPCALDEECALRSPDARCIEDATFGKHCAPVCSDTGTCDVGFSCHREAASEPGWCEPASGACVCDASMEGTEFGCELHAPAPHAELTCAGVQRCSAGELGSCEPALDEACNEADDDCDGKVDEDFVDAQGLYVSAEHCGACGVACAAPGEHVEAECRVDAGEVGCERRCADGFVDRDGLQANGCECELLDSTRPRVGVDADCDGQIDPTPDLVFVSEAGDDAQPGTSPETAVRSLAQGLSLGASLGRDVLIARGVYAGPITLPAGRAVLGGYSPDFTQQDSTLYPVVIEGDASLQGAPVLRCEDIHEATRVADVTIEAAPVDAMSQGSTAVFLDRCGPELVLERVTILAARAAAGPAGDDSSLRLPALGFTTLSELNGVAGGVGAPGGEVANVCPTVFGGTAGNKQCPSGDVGGGRGGDARCAALACDNATNTPCGNAGCSDFTTAGVCDIESVLAVAVANPAPAAGRGLSPGGAGVATYDAPTNHGECSFCDDNPSLPRFGDDGLDGAPGADGAGGQGCPEGLSIDALGRILAADGDSGSDGRDGSGGGGGSAGAGYAAIANTSGDCQSVPGAAGGGGGSGGCGAPGAAGGGGGGGSLGVLIQLAPGQKTGPSMLEVRIVTASGGDGGDGGTGAVGGISGSGGLGGTTEFWCSRNGGRGGAGGPGGSGGGGGGGCGGPSLGVYVAAGGGADADYVAALRAGLTVALAGAAGSGGRAGYSPGHPGGEGAGGTLADILMR